jgi:anti-anti-sigma factor
MSDIDPRSAPHHTERTVGDTTVVELRGEFDIFTAPPLAARLDALTAGPHPDLVLNLRSMTFIDCTGLGVLCRARNRALARHGRLRLVTDSRGFRLVLRVVGLAGVFELHPSLSTALARTPEAVAAPAATDGKDAQTTVPAVLLRSDGEVDAETLAYARTKIDTVVGRPGLPDVTGEVRITRAATHHADRPWSARAALHVGRCEVVVLAEEATGRELVDQLQDRLRRQTDKAAHPGHHGHRTPAPPWRGGSPIPRPADGSGRTADSHPA